MNNSLFDGLIKGDVVIFSRGCHQFRGTLERRVSIKSKNVKFLKCIDTVYLRSYSLSRCRCRDADEESMCRCEEKYKKFQEQGETRTFPIDSLSDVIKQ